MLKVGLNFVGGHRLSLENCMEHNLYSAPSILIRILRMSLTYTLRGVNIRYRLRNFRREFPGYFNIELSTFWITPAVVVVEGFFEATRAFPQYCLMEQKNMNVKAYPA